MNPIGSGSQGSTAGGVNVTASVTCTVGEVLVASVSMLDIGAGGGTIATPSGWTAAGSWAGVPDAGSTVTLHQRYFYKTAASTSESITAAPPSGGTTNCYGFACITRLPAGSTFNSTASSGAKTELANGAAANITSATVPNTGTLSNADAIAFSAFTADSGTGLNPAGIASTSSFTPVDENQNTGPNIGRWSGYKALSSTSAVGSAFSLTADPSMGAMQAVTVIFEAAIADQMPCECGDWYEGTTLAEVEGTDLGPWAWYADEVTPSRSGSEQIAFIQMPESFEWEDSNALDEVFYQWPWAQGPPPADIDTQVYPRSIEDGALQPVEFIDEDFAFFDAPRPAGVVIVQDQVVPEDGSLQPVEVIDEDFAFFDAPRPADVPPDLGGIECSDDQLEDADEDFGFYAIPFAVPVTDPPFIEDSSDQLEDVDEDFGFDIDPTPDDVYDQLGNEFGGFEDPADEDGEDFQFSPLPDDVVVVVDPIYGEDSSDQLEDQDEDFGFALAPLADDNDVAASRSYDADEQQEEDEFSEGFADQPLPADLAAPADQIVVEDSSEQLEDPDEDFGFYDVPLPEDAPMLAIIEDGNTREEDVGDEDFGTQSASPLPDDVQSDQVFVSFPDQSEEPEDEAYGFSTDPTVAELVIEEPLPFCDFPLQSEEPPDEDFGFSDLQTPEDFVPISPSGDVPGIDIRFIDHERPQYNRPILRLKKPEPVKQKAREVSPETKAQIRSVIESVAKDQIARGLLGDRTQSVRFGEIRLVLKPFAQAADFNWPALYEKLYREALDAALKAELQREFEIQDAILREQMAEDEALALLLLSL